MFWYKVLFLFFSRYISSPTPWVVFYTLLEVFWGFPGCPVVKSPPANAVDAGNTGSAPGWEDPLEESMSDHSSILAGKDPWAEESGSLQSMGSQRSWT